MTFFMWIVFELTRKLCDFFGNIVEDVAFFIKFLSQKQIISSRDTKHLFTETKSDLYNLFARSEIGSETKTFFFNYDSVALG